MRLFSIITAAVIAVNVRAAPTTLPSDCVREKSTFGVLLATTYFTALNDKTLGELGIEGQLSDFRKVRAEILDEISITSRVMNEASTEEELSEKRRDAERTLEGKLGSWQAAIDTSLITFTSDPVERSLKSNGLAMTFLRLGMRILRAVEVAAQECF